MFLPLVNGEEDPGSLVPASLRRRLRTFPGEEAKNLWSAQQRAVQTLEKSQVGGAERVLFLVDRSNLGKQALKEFQQYTTPDDGRKFTELYNVQRLTSNKVDPVARVVITTIQRLYSMLKGGSELDPDVKEFSGYETLSSLAKEPVSAPTLAVERAS